MEPNKKQIDILLLRREMQNVALGIGTYTQEELQDLLFRAIEVIDELRASKETIEAIRYDFNEKLVEEAEKKLLEHELSERYKFDATKCFNNRWFTV